jgi:hypothetical protein
MYNVWADLSKHSSQLRSRTLRPNCIRGYLYLCAQRRFVEIIVASLKRDYVKSAAAEHVHFVANGAIFAAGGGRAVPIMNDQHFHHGAVMWRLYPENSQIM